MLKIEWKVLRMRALTWFERHTHTNTQKRNKAVEFFNRSCPQTHTHNTHMHTHTESHGKCTTLDLLQPLLYFTSRWHCKLAFYDCLQLIVALAMPTMLPLPLLLLLLLRQLLLLLPLLVLLLFLCFTLAYFSIYCAALKNPNNLP